MSTAESARPAHDGLSDQDSPRPQANVHINNFAKCSLADFAKLDKSNPLVLEAYLNCLDVEDKIHKDHMLAPDPDYAVCGVIWSYNATKRAGAVLAADGEVLLFRLDDILSNACSLVVGTFNSPVYRGLSCTFNIHDSFGKKGRNAKRIHILKEGNTTLPPFRRFPLLTGVITQTVRNGGRVKVTSFDKWDKSTYPTLRDESQTAFPPSGTAVSFRLIYTRETLICTQLEIIESDTPANSSKRTDLPDRPNQRNVIAECLQGVALTDLIQGYGLHVNFSVPTPSIPTNGLKPPGNCEISVPMPHTDALRPSANTNLDTLVQTAHADRVRRLNHTLKHPGTLTTPQIQDAQSDLEHLNYLSEKASKEPTYRCIIMPPKHAVKQFFDLIERCFSTGRAATISSMIVTFPLHDDRTTSGNLLKTTISGILKQNNYPHLNAYGVSDNLTRLTSDTSTGDHFSKGDLTKLGFAKFGHALNTDTSSSVQVDRVDLQQSPFEQSLSQRSNNTQNPHAYLVAVSVNSKWDQFLAATAAGKHQDHWYANLTVRRTPNQHTYEVYPVDTSLNGMLAQLRAKAETDDTIFVVRQDDFWDRDDSVEVYVDTTSDKVFPTNTVKANLGADWIFPNRPGVYLVGTKEPNVPLADLQHRVMRNPPADGKKLIFALSRHGERFPCQHYSQAFARLLKANGIKEYYGLALMRGYAIAPHLARAQLKPVIGKMGGRHGILVYLPGKGFGIMFTFTVEQNYKAFLAKEGIRTRDGATYSFEPFAERTPDKYLTPFRSQRAHVAPGPHPSHPNPPPTKPRSPPPEQGNPNDGENEDAKEESQAPSGSPNNAHNTAPHLSANPFRDLNDDDSSDGEQTPHPSASDLEGEEQPPPHTLPLGQPPPNSDIDFVSQQYEPDLTPPLDHMEETEGKGWQQVAARKTPKHPTHRGTKGAKARRGRGAPRGNSSNKKRQATSTPHTPVPNKNPRNSSSSSSGSNNSSSNSSSSSASSSSTSGNSNSNNSIPAPTTQPQGIQPTFFQKGYRPPGPEDHP
jgi:hypothetical protein